MKIENYIKKKSEFVRFFMAGVFNTAITYLIYLILSYKVYYGLAYTISYLLGIIIMYFLNIIFVFRVTNSARRIFMFPFVYFVQYFLNYCMLYLLVDFAGIEKRIAPIFVIIVSVPVTFFLSRLILKGKG